jgi:hypothetical protein
VRRAVLALASFELACAGSVRFSPRLPDGVPDVSRWQKSSGSAELGSPRVTIDYELYVSPARPAVYSLTRYRITPRQASQRQYEKLQWDKDGREVHRYECAPVAPGRAHPCRWREFAKGSAEYDGELGGLLSVYSLHSSLLWRREDRR